MLIGIVLRGAAFVFRAYAAGSDATRDAWGSVFGASSALTPILLGMCLGALSTGDPYRWFDPFPVATGVLALLICAYLAAVYLAWEIARRAAARRLPPARARDLVAGRRRVDRRAVPGAIGGVAAVDRADVVAGRSCSSPPARCWRRSRSPRCGAGRFDLARYTCVAQIVALLAGWAAAQWPYLIYPDLTVANAAAPASTLSLTAWTLPFGLGALLPALWFLFRVFKSRAASPPRTP